MPDKARLFLFEGRALFIGPLADTSPHKHHAAQITIGLDGPFRILQNGTWQESRAIAIPPHQLDGGTSALAIALGPLHITAALRTRLIFRAPFARVSGFPLQPAQK